METIKGTSFFDKVKDDIKQYPYLNKNISCEILIIGGGIEGTILNYYLSKKYNVVLVDANKVAKNSTSIATALLEYQLDDFAKNLFKYLTKKEIVEIYKMGLNSINEIESLIKKLGNFCEFKKTSSFLYSNKYCDIKKIRDEFIFRNQNGFDCIFYDKNNNPFNFDIKAGIFDKNGGAEFNPYLFAKQMIDNSSNQNNIYENTKILQIVQKQDCLFCYTKYGNIIKAKKVIIATGFDTDLLDNRVKKLLNMQISYTITTKPIKNVSIFKDALIQDCLKNYHYLRILPDKRVIFGGEDIKFKKYINEAKANKKYNSLYKNLIKILNIKNIVRDYEFCGLFASTKNNLGIIGESYNKNILYFLSCGANGIINTFCGVKIIEDILMQKTNKFAKLFSPLRKA